jgi:AcrR family transcriptional regulator
MGRRSDHSRTQLREMITEEGHRQISEVGFARFSAREVAKRIGYSIGTIYNVFGSYDQLMLAINGRTLEMWQTYLEGRLQGVDTDRLRVAIEAYFDFAMAHRNAWSALYDFRLPEGEPVTDAYRDRVTAITSVVVRELKAALPQERMDEAGALARSLLATVHGHCVFAMNGTFQILGENDPLGAALSRVDDATCIGTADGESTCSPE